LAPPRRLILLAAPPEINLLAIALAENHGQDGLANRPTVLADFGVCGEENFLTTPVRLRIGWVGHVPLLSPVAAEGDIYCVAIR
jgi:hypothetical protein